MNVDDDWGDWDKPPLRCVDCHAFVNRDHSRQGFGHYRRCCACYERRQRGEKPKANKP